MMLPQEFLVDKDSEASRLHGFQNDVSIFVSIGTPINPKKHFNESFSYLNKETLGKYRFFNTGDFVGAEYSNNASDKKDRSLDLTLASSKAFYRIAVTNLKDNNETFLKVAASIRLDNNPLFSTKLDNLTESQTIQVTSLETTEVIAQALKQKDSLQKKLQIASEAEKQIPIETKGYSRPLIMLRKLSPTYSELARDLQIQGNVKLLVTFLANGQIGEIKLASTPGGSLENNAFKAAKKIKFLPAEKDGKPVDVTRFVEYNFTLY